MSSPEPMKGKILIVDDERNLVLMLSKILRRHGYEVLTAHDGEEGWNAITQAMADSHLPEDAERQPPLDAVMTDLQMPRMDGMALLKKVRDEYPDLPVIVLTGHGSIQSAVEAMKVGAMDYLIKPANPDEILIVLDRALEVQNLRAENRELRSQLGGRFESNYEIIGHSAAIDSVLGMVRNVSRNRSTVLITGESGTGKELVARAIHDSSPFARYPFIAVNCGALSETLLESQLFGHRRGAFTGAVNDHVGFFEAAEGGTLFLDEISEMSPHLQVKLLRAIQEREVIPVGDTAPRRINLRMICATNRDLEYEVRRRNFRQDLFYRLSVVNLYLAPLRERHEDIPDLVGHFILRYAREYDVAPKSVQPEAMEALLQYPWPGNIRELENVIEACFALSGSDTISVDDLPGQVFREPEEAMAAVKPMEDEELGGSSGAASGRLMPPGRTARPILRKPPVEPLTPPAARVNEEEDGHLSDEEPTLSQGAMGALLGAGIANIAGGTGLAGGAGVVGAARMPMFTQPFIPKAPESPLTLDEMEKRQILEALRRAKGKKVEAARILGIDRKRLYRKMKKYALD